MDGQVRSSRNSVPRWPREPVMIGLMASLGSNVLQFARCLYRSLRIFIAKCEKCLAQPRIPSVDTGERAARTASTRCGGTSAWAPCSCAPAPRSGDTAAAAASAAGPSRTRKTRAATTYESRSHHEPIRSPHVGARVDRWRHQLHRCSTNPIAHRVSMTSQARRTGCP